MSNSQRRKGSRRERELAALIGATKISRTGYTGPDLEWRDLTVEVKARAQDFKRLYQWLEDADLLALKADRRPWLIVLDVDTFLDLICPTNAK